MKVFSAIQPTLVLNIFHYNSLKTSFRSISLEEEKKHSFQDSLSSSSAELNSLTGVSKLLLNALEKILHTETSKTHDASRLRSLTYILIGKLSYRVPKLFCDDIRLTQQFFEALKTEDNECCLNIQEALKYVEKLLTFNQLILNILVCWHILKKMRVYQVNICFNNY
jgi:hypothetical protein